MRIAITGGIGSGKSFVCRRLEARGIKVYDCDAAAKRLIRESAEIHSKLTALIGDNAYISETDGSNQNGYRLNKAAVAEFLLASKENNLAVNAIVHPAVADDFTGSDYTWMECAILYESGFDRLVDRVIAVTAPDDVRIERIMKRDDISSAKAAEWIARQMPQKEVMRRADYEIINDGTQDVDRQIEEIINKL